MSQSNLYLERNETCAYQIIENEAIIVRLLPEGDSRVLSLNSIGTFIWELADGSLTLEELGRRVAEKYDVEAAQAVADIEAFAADLQQRGLAFWRQEAVVGVG